MSDVTIRRGDSKSLPFGVEIGDALNPMPVNLTGCTVTLIATSDATTIEKNSDPGGGITIDLPKTRGTGWVEIRPADTAGLPNVVTVLSYALKLRDADGRAVTIARGRLIVKPDVTLAA